jgi:DNA-binding CsgD family transcriptional regulator/PAS domain-containing protein
MPTSDALQPELWGVFLRGLAQASGVEKGALIAHDLAANEHRILASSGDETAESVSTYESHYWQFDEWTTRLARHGRFDRFFRGEEIWPNESMLGSVFYNEFLKPFDTRQMVCFATFDSAGVADGLSLYRSPREDDFSAETLAMLALLVPHLETALLTRRRLAALESRVSDLESALDRVSSALVLLDGKGRCILANRAARAILDQRSGLFLERSTLAARGAGESARLRAAIAVAIATGEGKSTRAAGAVTVSRPGRRPLHAVVAPFRPQAIDSSGDSSGQSLGGPHAGLAARNAAAIVFLHDPEQRAALPSETLRMLFGLTPAEARLALAMLDGQSLAEAAELHRVGRETVRSQAKAILEKTGTRRQSELVRLLAGLATGKEGPG